MHAVAAEAWDGRVSGFDHISQEQTYAFASRRWPTVKPEAVLFSLEQKIIGGALVMVQPIPLRLGAVALINKGPIFHDAGIADRHALHRAMLDLLIREYAEARGMMLTIQLRAATASEDCYYDQLIERGFSPGPALPFPDRYIVSLALADDRHRDALHQKWRYHLGKSEQEGLVFETGGAGAMARFSALYEAMSRRKKFPDYSAYHTLPGMLGTAEKALRPELFFVRHNDETVAGAVIFTAGQTATYLYGATSDRALPLRAGYFLHWEIIRWLKRHTRACWYDLGGTDGFHGLHQFKKGLVGNAGVIAPMPPWLNIASGRLPLLLGRGAFAARAGLNAARRLLDAPWEHRAKPDLVPRKATR
jgi:hypothetical protein